MNGNVFVDTNILIYAYSGSEEMKRIAARNLIATNGSDCETLYAEDMHHSQVIEKKLTIINPFR